MEEVSNPIASCNLKTAKAAGRSANTFFHLVDIKGNIAMAYMSIIPVSSNKRPAITGISVNRIKHAMERMKIFNEIIAYGKARCIVLMFKIIRRAIMLFPNITKPTPGASFQTDKV